MSSTRQKNILIEQFKDFIESYKRIPHKGEIRNIPNFPFRIETIKRACSNYERLVNATLAKYPHLRNIEADAKAAEAKARMEAAKKPAVKKPAPKAQKVEKDEKDS